VVYGGWKREGGVPDFTYESPMYRISSGRFRCDLSSARYNLHHTSQPILPTFDPVQKTYGIGGSSCAEASFSFNGALEMDVARRAALLNMLRAV
jgi:hypothetical protein